MRATVFPRMRSAKQPFGLAVLIRLCTGGWRRMHKPARLGRQAGRYCHGSASISTTSD